MEKTPNPRKKQFEIKFKGAKGMYGKWARRSSLPIETRIVKKRSSYDHLGKKYERAKNLYNATLCVYAIDLQKVFLAIGPLIKEADVRTLKCLILDSAELATSSILHQNTKININSLYICSDEVQFRFAPHGRTFNGKLSVFIESIHFNPKKDEKFSILALDFCGGWGSEMEQCFDKLISLDYLEPIGILSFTVRYSQGAKAEYWHANSEEARKRVAHLASTRGFDLGYQEVIQNVQSRISTYIMKFIHTRTALDHKTGFNVDAHGNGVDNWVRQSPQKVSFNESDFSVEKYIYQTFGYKVTLPVSSLKRKSNDGKNSKEIISKKNSKEIISKKNSKINHLRKK